MLVITTNGLGRLASLTSYLSMVTALMSEVYEELGEELYNDIFRIAKMDEAELKKETLKEVKRVIEELQKAGE